MEAYMERDELNKIIGEEYEKHEDDKDKTMFVFIAIYAGSFIFYQFIKTFL